MEDWRYAGFENRYRGSEDEVKQQQAVYLDYFQPGQKVLDMSVVYTYLILLGASGFLIDWSLSFVRRKMCPWFGD